MGSGNYFYPLNRDFLNLSGGTVTGDTLFTANLSAATIFSGSTNLGDLLNSVVSGGTRVVSGINTFTAGTIINTSVNITGGSFSDLFTSGITHFFQASATTLSGGTIFSANTDIYNIFVNKVNAGSNISISGTSISPIVNVVESPSFNNINYSGTSIGGNSIATNVSATTFYSGSTNLQNVIQNMITGVTTGITSTIQNGLNTYTGGTGFLPTINVSALTIDNINVSGTSMFTGGLSANTLSGGTIYSGNTDVSLLFATPANISLINSQLITKANLSGATFTGGIISPSLSATTLSGGTIYSGATELSLIINSQITGVTSGLINTHVQNGLNTYTGGTPDLPTVNISALTINNLSVSGNTFLQSVTANTLSASTLFSGSTDLVNIFTQGSGTINTLPIWTAPKILGNSIITQNISGITVNGSVNILGNVDITGTATTINTQIVQSLDNNILLNYSGTHATAIGGGIMVLSGQPSGVESIWATDINGNWSANTQIIATNGLNVYGGVLQSGGTDLYSIFDPLGSGVQSVVAGSNITTGGTITHPIVSVVTSPSFNNLTLSGTGIANAFSATTISGGTLYSGSTELSLIINSQITGITSNLTSTRVQPGLNTYTGGTPDLPTVNVSALTINNLTVSGNTSLGVLSATTYFSGATELSLIINSQITGITSSLVNTHVQNGLNTYTGGTAALPTVNVSALTINTITASGTSIFNGGLSANTLSGGTIYSGATELSLIINSQITGITSSLVNTHVQNGLNTYTGGTDALPTVNISGGSFNSITASGTSVFTGGLSANTLSGGTILSGSTNLYDIFITTNDGNDITRVQPGLNTYTGGTGNNPTVNISAATLSYLSATTISGGTFYGNGSGLTLLSYLTGATSVGSGYSILSSVSGQNVNLKTISPGSGITIFSSGDTLIINSNSETFGTLREGASTTTSGATSKIINIITGFTGGSYIVESYVTAYNANSEYGMWKRVLGVYYTGGTPIITYEKADFDKQNDGLSPISVSYSPTTAGTISIIVSGSTDDFEWKSYHEVVDEGANNVFDISHYGAFGLSIDNGSMPITIGQKGYITIPYSATIYGWDLIGNTSGTCVIDLWKTTLSSFPPTSANTITGSQMPTLSNQMINRNDALTGWTTSINANDILAFTVLTASTVSRVNLTIKTIKN